MYEDIKQKAYDANMLLYRTGLAPFMSGCASECDREAQVFAIRPEGVSFEVLTPEKMCVVTFEGKKVDGEDLPAQDAVTHAMLYRKFESVNGVVHTHSINVVSFAQAGYSIPALGTFHAMLACGEIPCVRKLEENEIKYDYEFNVGKVITEYFAKNKIDEKLIPAALVKYDGAFVWGKDSLTAVENACMLETTADAALKTLLVRNLAIKNDKKGMSAELLKMNFLRAHEDIFALDEE